MGKFLLFLVVISTFSKVTRAADPDVSWVSFSPQFTTSPKALPANACEEAIKCVDIYLVAHIVDGSIRKAYLTDSKFAFLQSRIELTAEEISSITLHRDAFGRPWVKSIGANGRIVSFLFKRASSSLCASTVPAATIPGNLDLTMEFPTKGLGEDILISPTTCQNFATNANVNVSLRFVQRQVPN